MREPICHLDGVELPLAQARVSALDRGFLLGDGVYEMIPAYGRRPFCLSGHLARLRRSLRETGMTDPLGEVAWRGLVTRLLELNEPEDQCVYIQVTRGTAPRQHAFPDGVAPTVFAYSSAFPHVDAAARSRGVAAITLPDARWLRADVKAVGLLGSVLARQAAAEVGAQEAVLVRDGWLTEATAANVWLVRGGRLLCPPADHLKLEGVRVPLLAGLAAEAGIALHRRPVAEWELRRAEEILLSSATREVLAVTELDGMPVGVGRPGPVYEALYAGYQQAKAQGRD